MRDRERSVRKECPGRKVRGRRYKNEPTPPIKRTIMRIVRIFTSRHFIEKGLQGKPGWLAQNGKCTSVPSTTQSVSQSVAVVTAMNMFGGVASGSGLGASAAASARIQDLQRQEQERQMQLKFFTSLSLSLFPTNTHSYNHPHTPYSMFKAMMQEQMDLMKR